MLPAAPRASASRSSPSPPCTPHDLAKVVESCPRQPVPLGRWQRSVVRVVGRHRTHQGAVRCLGKHSGTRPTGPWSACRVVKMVEAGGGEPPSRVRRMTTEGSTRAALALAGLRGAMTSGPLSGPRLRPAAPRTGSHATPVHRGHHLSVAREGPVPATALPPSSGPWGRMVPVAVCVPMQPPTLIRTFNACSRPGQ